MHGSSTPAAISSAATHPGASRSGRPRRTVDVVLASSSVPAIGAPPEAGV